MGTFFKLEYECEWVWVYGGGAMEGMVEPSSSSSSWESFVSCEGSAVCGGNESIEGVLGEESKKEAAFVGEANVVGGAVFCFKLAVIKPPVVVKGEADLGSVMTSSFSSSSMVVISLGIGVVWDSNESKT